MTRQFRLSLASSAALVGALGLLAVLGWQDEGPRFDLPPITLPSESSVKARVMGPIASYAALAEHTLFSPTRRPEPPPKAAPTPVNVVIPPPPLAPPPTTLLAVLISSNHRAAILRLATGRTSTVVEGDVLGGWTVARVAEDRVLFHSASSDAIAEFPAHGLAASQTGFPSTRDMSDPTPTRRRR